MVKMSLFDTQKDRRWMKVVHAFWPLVHEPGGKHVVLAVFFFFIWPLLPSGWVSDAHWMRIGSTWWSTCHLTGTLKHLKAI